MVLSTRSFVIICIGALLGFVEPIHAQQAQSLEARFQRADKNNDQQLSRTEFQNRALFQRLDRNRDNLLSRQEVGLPPATTRPAAGTSTARPNPRRPQTENPVASTPPRRNSAENQPRTNRPNRTGNGKRVLIVIANNDFFYREYAHPREELEKAGFQVDVAAGHKRASRPHNNSGQGSDGGVVMPDLSLSQVDSSRYEAIMFSGGWGSSQYQYGFPGRYPNSAYNGDRQTKTHANRLINEFIEQDKIVGALCHGVSVLAWARVNGKSPLAGKRVSAPPRSGPRMIFNGQSVQHPSRWDSQVNQARLNAPRSIGNPNTPSDDVSVDGKIITGEDDSSAREFGRVLVRELNKS